METLQPEPDAEITETGRVAETIRQDLKSRGMIPIQMVQDGGVIDFVKPRSQEANLNDPYTGEDARLEQTLEISRRPFCIIFAAHPEKRDVVLKARTKEDQSKRAANEIDFLKFIAPVLTSLMSESGRNVTNKVRFPSLIDSRKGDPPTLCLENYIKGRISGSIHQANPEILSEEDIDELITFIRFFQDELSADKIEEISPESEFPRVDVYDKYKGDFNRRKDDLELLIGRDAVDQMESILVENEERIRNWRTVFGSCDINPANIIKTQSGELALIDWERAGFTNSSAYEYGFLFATLWSNPDLQQKFLQKACQINQDDPEFKEKFRVDFLFNRGSGELLNYWKKALEIADTEEEREICHRAINRLSALIKDAVSKSGIWAEDMLESDKESR